MNRRSPLTRISLHNEPDTGASGGTGGSGTGAGKVEFTAEQHAEINRIRLAAEAEAARKATRDAKAEIDAYLAAEKATQERSKLDDNARLAAELADAKAAAAAATAEAAKVTARANATTALLAAGCQPAHIDDAIRLIDVDGDIATEATALATRLPALFTPTADGTPPPAGVTPPRPPATHGGGTKTAAERAKERFAAKYPKSAA